MKPILKTIQMDKAEIMNEGDRLFKAWMTVEGIDKDNEILPIDEFKKVMPVLAKRGGPIIYGHTNKVIGKMLSYEFTEKDGKEGILITGQVFNDTQLDNKVWEEVKQGTLTGLSFGGAALGQPEIVQEKGGQMARKLSKIEGYEISLVERPANPGALMAEVNMLAKGGKLEQHDYENENGTCKLCGYSRNDPIHTKETKKSAWNSMDFNERLDVLETFAGDEDTPPSYYVSWAKEEWENLPSNVKEDLQRHNLNKTAFKMLHIPVAGDVVEAEFPDGSRQIIPLGKDTKKGEDRLVGTFSTIEEARKKNREIGGGIVVDNRDGTYSVYEVWVEDEVEKGSWAETMTKAGNKGDTMTDGLEKGRKVEKEIDLTKEDLLKIEEYMDKQSNPWAICTSSVGREDANKFEKCVRHLKEKAYGKTTETTKAVGAESSEPDKAPKDDSNSAASLLERNIAGEPKKPIEKSEIQKKVEVWKEELRNLTVKCRKGVNLSKK